MRRISLIILLTVFLFGLTGFVSAQAPLVPCGNPDQPPCTPSHFFVLVSNIVNYFIFTLAVPLATVAIAYAGITLALHPKEEGKRTQAKEILSAALWGLVIVLGAWLIVTTIVNYIVEPRIRNQINSFVPKT